MFRVAAVPFYRRDGSSILWLSLCVVDLDLSITPDVLGLRAFDVAKPLTCMLSGQFPNELRLMIPPYCPGGLP